MKLGRLEHNPARLAAVPSHRFGIAEPPPLCLIRDYVPFAPGLYGNDRLPCCTAVAVANAARAFSWARSACDIVVAEARVKAFYAGCVGCADTDEAMAGTDGAVLLDVIDRGTSAGVDLGQQVPLVPTAARIAPDDRAGMSHAMLHDGAVILGVELSISDQRTPVWTVSPPTSAGDPAAGSWGGHAAFGWGYTGLADDDQVMIGTWGIWQAATWAWVRERTAEAYSCSWGQLAAA